MPSDSAPSPPPSPPPVPRPPRGWHRSAHGSGDELGMYYDPSRPPAEYEERARYELPPEPLARFEDSYYDRRHSSEALRYDDRRRSPIAPLGRRPRSPPSYPEPFSRRSDPYYDRRDTEALHYEDRRYSPTSFPPRRPRSPPGFSYSRDIYYGDHRRDTPPLSPRSRQDRCDRAQGYDREYDERFEHTLPRDRIAYERSRDIDRGAPPFPPAEARSRPENPPPAPQDPTTSAAKPTANPETKPTDNGDGSAPRGDLFDHFFGEESRVRR